MDLNSILLHASSADAAVRNQAETMLKQALETQYSSFLLALCAEFAAEGKPEVVRQLAGLYIKNALSAQNEEMRKDKARQWLSLDEKNRETIRNALLQNFHSTVAVVRHTTAQVVAAIAVIEMPRKMWPMLVQSLLAIVANPEVAEGSMISCLSALGFMCDDLEIGDLKPEEVDLILTAIIDGMRQDRSNDIRLAAATALNPAIVFANANFSIDMQRNAIMQSICEITQCPDARVRTKAYECVVTVAEHYYELLGAYAQTLFQLSAATVQKDDEAVALQAIEYWSTVCEIEAERYEGETQLNLMLNAYTNLIPILLEACTKQSGTDSDEEWTLSTAAGMCFKLLAETVKDDIIKHVIPFVTSNINSSNWRHKEAAILAFGSILSGPSPDKLKVIVTQALPHLLPCLSDANALVRDTTAWTLSEICSLHLDILTRDMLEPLVTATSLGLVDPSAKVAAHSCSIVNNLSVGCAATKGDATNMLSMFMAPMLQQLFACTVRPDANTEGLRDAAYETIITMVTNAALDIQNIVYQVLVETTGRLELSLNSPGDSNDKMNLHSKLCVLIGTSIEKLPIDFQSPQTQAQIDKIMQLFLQVLAVKESTAHLDVYEAMGLIAHKIGKPFIRYMQHIQDFVLMGLRNKESREICESAITFIGFAAGAVGEDLSQFIQPIMQSLFVLLQSPDTPRSVKPKVISVFSEIALAINGHFEMFVGHVLGTLMEAGKLSYNDDSDEDFIEYVNLLRETIFEAYTGILHGLSSATPPRHTILAGELGRMLELIVLAGTAESRTEETLHAAAGLLGDLFTNFGPQMKQYCSNPKLIEVINKAASEEYSKSNGEYARRCMAQASKQ